MKLKTYISEIKAFFNVEKTVVLAFSAWFCVSYFLLIFSAEKFVSLSFMAQYNFWLVAAGIVAAFVCLSCLAFFTKIDRIEVAILVIISILYFLQTSATNRQLYYSIVVIVLMFAILYYGFCIRKISIPQFGKVSTLIIVVFLAVLFVVFTGLIGYCRYMRYATPCYDFGIFCQMFEYMKDTLTPMTTCERGELLSHFAVHVSPIYYLILPFYMIFPSPVTLQIAQSVILASGIIPLYLICRHFKFSNKITLCVCACFAFYPALSGGMSYDIHENAFLAPLLLWLMYFIEKKKNWGIFLFAILTLLVKEDAAIYVAFVALFMMFSRKEYKKSALLFIISCTYFVGAVAFLDIFGNGAMMNRYNNYYYESNGNFLTVIKSVIMNPAHLLSESFAEDRFEFILKMLIPIGFLPMLSRKYSRLILLGPFLLMNLMSDYPYQHDINFQYTFGVLALFFYLVCKNLSDFRPRMKEMFAVFIAVSSLCMLTCTYSHSYHLSYFVEDKTTYETISEGLEYVPDDALVYSSTFFVPQLSDHKELYQLNPGSYASARCDDAEYIVIDLRYPDWIEINDYCKSEKSGMTSVFYEAGAIAVYETPLYKSEVSE